MVNNTINLNTPQITPLPIGGIAPNISAIVNKNTPCLSMLRLDTLHPILAGNKWFKIKNAIAYCHANNLAGIISFGGNYSNHLHALSYACKLYNLKSVGIINGTKTALLHTPTMADALSFGMQLQLGGFNAYKLNICEIQNLMPQINLQNYYLMPMGGSNALSVLGAAEIYTFIPLTVAAIWVAAGSGTTALALYNKLQTHQTLHIVTPFKTNNMLDVLKNKPNVHIHYFNLAGTFGKQNNELINFITGFKTEQNIMLDLVYTANLMQCLFLHYTKHTTTNIMAIHTGGLQGNRSINI